MQLIRDTSELPRIDYRLSLGENPKFERITPKNAYRFPYVRLVYRLTTIVHDTGIYELCATELVNGKYDDNDN